MADPKRRRNSEKIVVSKDPGALTLIQRLPPLYNVQLVRDLDSQLCLSYQVFAQPTDAGTFGPMLERVANWTGVKPKAMLVDAGYVTACNLAICRSGGHRVVRPVARERLFAKEKEARREAASDRKGTLHLGCRAKHVSLPGGPFDAMDRPSKTTAERRADQRGA
jgi:hypothetical protein